MNSRRKWGLRGLGIAVLAGLAVVAAGCGKSADQAQAPADYHIYATNEHAGSLTVIDGKTLEAISTVTVGKRPRGIRPGPNNRELYIALSGSPIAGPGVDESTLPPADKSADGIGVFDIASGKITRVITGVSDPEKLAVSKDGKLYITSEDTGMLVIVDIASGKTLAMLPVGEEPEGINLSPDGRYAFVTSESDNEVSIIDTASESVVKRIPVGERPRNTAFSPDGIKAYVPGESDGSVTVINTTRQVALRTVRIREGDVRPMDILVSPDGKTVYVTTGRGGTLLALDGETLAEKKEVEVGKRPWGLAMSPDGKYLFTANGPSNDVTVVDAASMTVVKKIPAGEGPWGVAVVPASR